MATQQVKVQPGGNGAAPDRRPVGKDVAPDPDKPDGSSAQRVPPRRAWISFLIILLINIAIARMLFPNRAAPVKVPYTLFREQIVARNVQAIYSRGTSITGRFNKAITYPRDTTGGGTPTSVSDFATELPSFVDPGLETLLIDNGAEISAKPIQEDNFWTGLLSSFAPTLLIIALYVWMFRRAAKAAAVLAGCSAAASARAPRAGTIRRPRARSPSTTSPVSTKPRMSWSRSSSSFAIRRSTRGSAAPLQRACCWSGRPVRGRRCSRAPWQARQAFPSSR